MLVKNTLNLLIKFSWCWFLFLILAPANAQQPTTCAWLDSLDYSITESELINRLPDYLTTDCEKTPSLLLAEESPLFKGKGSKTIQRIRSWSYAVLAKDTSWHKAIKSFALADLSNSTNAYVLSAIALGIKDFGLLSQQENLRELLEQAIRHVRYRDRPITFEAYFPDDPKNYSYTNAKKLLGDALESLEEKKLLQRFILIQRCNLL